MAVLFGLGLHILRDVCFGDLFPHIIFEDISPFRDKIDNALEGLGRTDRQLYRDGVSAQTIDDSFKTKIKVGAHPVHLINKTDTGDMILLGLAPNGLALRLPPRSALQD